MLVKTNSSIIRSLQFDDELLKHEDNPKSWQFKPFYDASTMGVEFVWIYEDYKPNKDILDEVDFKQLSKNLFSIQFKNCFVATNTGYNLFIFQHHSTFINNKSKPIAVPQVVECDWHTGEVEIIFKSKPCIFRKNKPFAQGCVVPNRQHTIKQMTSEEVQRYINANDFIENNKSSLITRSINSDHYQQQNNIYNRLSELNAIGKLPSEIKPNKSLKPKLKLYGNKTL